MTDKIIELYYISQKYCYACKKSDDKRIPFVRLKLS